MKALDAGACGIICPMVSLSEKAARFVRYLRYPPLRQRSFRPTRASAIRRTGWQRRPRRGATDAASLCRGQTASLGSGAFAVGSALTQADGVPLHAPRADKVILGADELATLQPIAVLGSPARGGLVDEAAMAEALEMTLAAEAMAAIG
jgi:hypothetical protein